MTASGYARTRMLGLHQMLETTPCSARQASRDGAAAEVGLRVCEVAVVEGVTACYGHELPPLRAGGRVTWHG